jgi:hypothetical protein
VPKQPPTRSRAILPKQGERFRRRRFVI